MTEQTANGLNAVNKIKDLLVYLKKAHNVEIGDCLPMATELAKKQLEQGMTAKQIKDAVDVGKTVNWAHEGYVVVKAKEDYLIKCIQNGHCIGLTWQDGVTLNGDSKDFFVSPY
jgi:hypothetical protein